MCCYRLVVSSSTEARPRRTRVFALPETRWAAAALVLFLCGLAVQSLGGPAWPLYLACYVTGGWEPGLAGLRALRAKTLDVDLLMVVAAIGAAAIGQITDGGLLIVIFATSGALEALATARTEDSVRGLLDLAPDTATRLDPDDTEHPVAATDLAIGDVLLIRPGERIAADGVVTAGAGEVHQATITGEPLPVDKTAGAQVFAGTLNGTGSLRVRVERRAGDSVVARIATLVERASRTKARTQLFIEKVEQRYSIGMVTATIALFVIPLPWGDSVTDSLLRAMTFMIVASPCAVVLATMPPLLAAIANAGRRGVLVKSAVVMEQFGGATRVAFDKTGTLTHGIPALAELRVLPGANCGEDELLRLVAAAERPSEHPLAAAIVRAARERGLDIPVAEEFSAQPGRGVTARVDGHQIRVSAPNVVATTVGTGRVGADVVAMAAGAGRVGANVVPMAAGIGRVPVDVVATTNWVGRGGANVVATTIDEFERSGCTTSVVVVDHRPVGVLALTDQVRAEAADAVAAIARLTGAAPVLLTGDNAGAAERVARQVGIADVRAGLLPEDKVVAVRELAALGERVVVVGDGVNDAPALAAAHAGVAMGGAGADLTLQAADVVIVRDDLSVLPALIELSGRARRVVVANLVIAAVFITGLVAWDLFGHLPLPLGVAGHEGSTVLVGLNGLRLLRTAGRPTGARPV